MGSRMAPVEEVKKQLLRGEYMTNYQIERLAKGERSGYFYGPYKVLYAVGAGTFARVFRAVHRQTGEIVALKVLRKRFSDPDKPEQAAAASSSAKASWGSCCGIPTSCPSTTSPPTASRTTWSWSSSRAGTSATSSRSAPRSSRCRPRS